MGVRTSPANIAREAARALGADEDEAVFKAKLGVITRSEPKDEPSSIRKKKTA
jgi:hypothetical protein